MYQLILSEFIKPILPELIMILSSIVCLLISIFKKKSIVSKWQGTVIIIAILFSIGYLLSTFNNNVLIAFDQMFISDSYIVFSKIIILTASVVFFIIYLNNHKNGQLYTDNYEFLMIITFAIVGMMVMISANNLLTMYLGIELQSLCLYVLAAFDRDKESSSEAGIKYFILGALASGLLLYGISLIYGLSGTTNFVVLSKLYLLSTGATAIPSGILIGVILVIIGISFKIAAVPFHMWAPDVYEGSPMIVTAFFATVPKLATVLLLIKLLVKTFALWVDFWQQILIVLSVASMVIGALGAISQNNIKRLLAYSSISHIGYILLSIVVSNQKGIQAALIYLIIYIIMNLGIFACIIWLRKGNEIHDDVREWSGLSVNHPSLAFSIAVLMFSQAGIPPIAGFFAKFYVFSAALQSGFYLLVIIAVITSVVSAYYYLRVIKIMYFDQNKGIIYKGITPDSIFLITVIVLFNLLFCLFAKMFLALTMNVTNILLI